MLDLVGKKNADLVGKKMILEIRLVWMIKI